MPDLFHYRRRVEFADTDAAGIAHFTSLIRYAESAEHALLRSVGSSVMRAANRPQIADAEGVADSRLALETSELVAGAVDWPRVRLEVDFASPAYFEDELDIAVQVERLGRSSVHYRLTLRLAEDFRRQTSPAVDGTLDRETGQANSGVMICVVRLVVVCCRRAADGQLRSVPIPDDYRSQLGVFLVEA